jgi:hypothetical protein
MPCRCIGGVEVQLHSFFDLCTRQRQMVSFTPQPLYPQGNSPWYSLDRRLGGPQSHSGCGGEEKNSHSCPKKKRLFTLQFVANVTISISLCAVFMIYQNQKLNHSKKFILAIYQFSCNISSFKTAYIVPKTTFMECCFN